MAAWKPVAGITVLRDQVNKRFPRRDKRSDGIVGDSAHASRPSDHNPDSRGYVHALDLDEDFGGKGDNMRFANELIEYARSGSNGAERLKYVVYEDKVASGTHANEFWVWRGSGYGHTHHIHVSFTKVGEDDKAPFKLPILGYAHVWDGVVPAIENVWKASKFKLPSISAWRVATRLHDLGYWAGRTPVKYVQLYPAKAVRAYQEAKGLPTNGYNKKTHDELFGL